MPAPVPRRPRPVLLALLVGFLLVAVLVEVLLAQRLAARPDWITTFLLLVPLGAAFVAVGAAILLRGGWNPIGWLLVANGTVFATGVSAAALLPPPYGDWVEASWVSAAIMFFALMMLVFPSGRLPTGPGFGARTARAAARAVPIGILLEMASEPIGFVPRAVADVGGLIGAAILIGGAASLVVRFRRSHGEERAQLSWVVAALALLVVTVIATNLAVEGLGLGEDVFYLIAYVTFLAIPVSFAVAILRYRLYDIGRLVRRTVSYALVVAVLVGVYAIGVLGLGSLIGRGSTLVVAGSTLAAAALFDPLRRRVQQRVDRRFNRPRFDAELEVERFAARLRTQLNLDDLAGDLLRVVSKTVQPSTASMWIRDDPQ